MFFTLYLYIIYVRIYTEVKDRVECREEERMKGSPNVGNA